MRVRPLILALGGALAVLALSAASPATPVLAASAIASHGAAATAEKAISAQQVVAMISKPGSYSPAQLAAAKAYLLAHPFTGTIEINQAPKASGGPVGVRPNISVGFYWWGIRIHLTNADVTSLFSAMVTYGTAAVAAALCAPGVWLAVVCGAIGALAGWLVVTVVLQATNNFGGCALNIDRTWYGYSYWYCT